MKFFIAFLLIAAATAAVVPVRESRQRRDVSEIVKEYLPPVDEAVPEVVVQDAESAVDPVVAVKEAEPEQDSAVLGAEGYEYKTVRRLKLRHRRDVSEIANEYLPPAGEAVAEVVVQDAESAVDPVVAVKEAEPEQDSAVLAADGYQYKTVRRLKLRHRRDVSEIANEYLPPTGEPAADVVVEEIVESEPAAEVVVQEAESADEPVVAVKEAEPEQDSAVLGAEGYEYKTVRRLKLRHRRDVSEIANEYLPPANEAASEVVVQKAELAVEPAVAIEETEPAQDSAVLGADGYQYKTVRRLKLRHRRDVSEIASEYLPPVDEVAPEVVAEEVAVAVKEGEPAQDSAVLGADGYQYKTVRRLKLRHR